ncbi:unnamed protein product [Protopolystoma xenopodis]|uniref:Uncharacterized protein n=1 Tax=Protopolystoma xenopodis TaxID=117903 RepID=A0A3S5CU48_9PLAT|nr:unnamed protein product [Protopolystoma xenopodis]
MCDRMSLYLSSLVGSFDRLFAHPPLVLPVVCIHVRCGHSLVACPLAGMSLLTVVWFEVESASKECTKIKFSHLLPRPRPNALINTALNLPYTPRHSRLHSYRPQCWRVSEAATTEGSNRDTATTGTTYLLTRSRWKMTTCWSAGRLVGWSVCMMAKWASRIGLLVQPHPKWAEWAEWATGLLNGR